MIRTLSVPEAKVNPLRGKDVEKDAAPRGGRRSSAFPNIRPGGKDMAKRQTKFALGLALAAAGAALSPGTGPAQPPSPLAVTAAEPDWMVADRFRLFSEGAAAARADLLLRRMSAPGSIAQHHRFLADALTGSGGEVLRTSYYDDPSPTVGGSGAYDPNYLYPREYRILVRSTDPADAGKRCRWRGPAETREERCDTYVTLSVGPGRRLSDGWGVETALHLSVDGGAERAPMPIRFRDMLIVALGDSYISGEGNPDVPSIVHAAVNPVFERADWPANLRPTQYQRARWWDEACHRSLLSFPVLAALGRAAQRPREALSLVHLGCSGATVDDIIKAGQSDLVGTGGKEAEPQIVQLERLLAAAPGGRRRVPDRILLSVGGNDSGFVGVIKTLLLPPNGYTTGKIGAVVVGAFGGTVCPYRNSGALNGLCLFSKSAELRIETALPSAYKRLAARLRQPEWGPVHQFAYPNPIVGENGVPCDVPAPRDPGDVHAMGGFEAAMGLIPRPIQGNDYSWSFGFDYRREVSPFVPPETVIGSGCDWAAESSDSEICQALWVHNRLNRAVASLAGSGWGVIDRHLSVISGHGLCRSSRAFPLGLARVVDGRWADGWTPRSYLPYDSNNPRWFRTTNDSAVTQYGGPKRFFHGSVHPTLSAHLAYAQAALDGGLAR